MPIRQAFVDAVTEAPDDDGPRLVFADWLEENGDPERAEFIRVQCELARLGRYDPRRRPLVRREKELLGLFGKRWMDEEGLTKWVADHLDAYQYTARYARGFIEFARFHSPGNYLQAAGDLHRRTPLTGVGLHLNYSITHEESRRAVHTFRRIWKERRGLTAVSPLTPEEQAAPAAFPESEELRRALESPWFAGLQSFELLSTSYFDRPSLELVLRAAASAQLRGLALSDNALLINDGWGPFATASLPALESLTLDECFVGPVGLRAITHSPGLTGLRRLGLAAKNNEIGADGYRTIASSPHLPSLEALLLHAQRGGADGLCVLAGWPGLARLTRLDLSFNHADHDEEDDYNDALAAFASSPHWGELRELNLEGDSAMTVGALEALLTASNLRSLRVLSLDAAGADEAPRQQDDTAELLLRCPYLADDLELHFRERGLSEGCKRRLSERFGDGLILNPGDGMNHRID